MKQKIVAIICALFVLPLIMSSCAQSGNSGDKPADAAVDTAASQGAVGQEDSVGGGEAQATSGATAKNDTTAESGAEATVSLIGDSVPLGAVAQIEEALPGVKMLVRTDRDLAGPGLELLKQENSNGELGDIVVLALGTSNLTAQDIENAIDVIGDGRQIVFVNAYRGGDSYIKKVNAAIDEVAASHPGNFTVADWHGYVESHGDIKLAEDNCHLTKDSAVDYASVIKAGVDAARGNIGA